MTECPPTALWTPDPLNGKLEFLDAAGFTIPNYMIRWSGMGDRRMLEGTYDGEDREVVDGIVAYPRIERVRKVNLECQMNFWSNAAGTLFDSRVKGERVNWVTLNGLAADTLTESDGLQSLRWTPYDGATAVTFNARVEPPVKGSVGADGHGRAVGIVLNIPDPVTQGLP